jgi:hypothetical protein
VDATKKKKHRSKTLQKKKTTNESNTRSIQKEKSGSFAAHLLNSNKHLHEFERNELSSTRG